ncbi:AfsR/SARP family transcriptional regulator [Nonomuraea cavernae]|uniref:SARP family transcriptional regulator n=1 Tax=Nonomuraea cavernae TaxID=2045107 RepID=A0A918DEB0_9ACTN|nr:BTAD domain-containing putative transcriptional regulator [Nonomuraea cavernae]MCA2183587.1 winged helix-turn-helix domain-containing protein [Nonomuraea cavernae]GGO60751.1 SARP family transcriptional regulator [Nonomuraea cavernae]
MEARLLGPLCVSDGGRTIHVTSGRQRALLAALLVNPNQPLSADHLIEVLWGNRPPENARAALRTYTMRLRQTLGQELGARIVTRPQGYLIKAETHEIDLLLFQRHAANARAAVREDSWETAAAELLQALALWRGEPFTEVPSTVLRERELPHIEQLYLRTLELHYEAQLRFGQHHDAVLELERTIESHPLRERFWAQLMTALYRSRRKGDALTAFQKVHRQLVGELGIEPGPELQRLHQAILNDDVGLAFPKAQEEPRVDEGRGGGAGRLGAPQPTIEPPPTLVPRQLPLAPRHFTGRLDARHTLNLALNETQREGRTAASVVVIGGIGGIGKTALAVHWAHQVADLFPDGQLFLNLRGFETADHSMALETALRSLLDAFAVPKEHIPAGLADQAALFRSTLAGKRVLLILDNVQDAEQVLPLIPASQGCLTIVTSRNQLTGLLVRTGAHSVSLGPLEVGETIELIEKLIGRQRTEAEPESMAKLVAMCDRIPLAASIMASKARIQPSLSLTELIGIFETIPSPLDRFDTGDTVTSVRSLLDGSYRHLTDDARRLLRLLGLHHGNQINHAAAASLTAMSLENTRKALVDLRRNHLVENVRPGQYSMHDLIRSFAVEVVNREETETGRCLASNRVLNYYVHSVHGAVALLMPMRRFKPLPTAQRRIRVSRFHTPAEAAAWFEANRDSIMSALLHAPDDGFPLYCWRLVERISPLLERLGHWHDWRRAARRAAETARSLGDLYAEAVSQLELGSVADLLNPADDSARHGLDRALTLFEELGDVAGQARTHYRLTLFHGRRHRQSECQHHSEQAFILHGKDANLAGQAEALNALGWFCVSFGDYDTAISTCRKALKLYAGSGNLTGEADTWDSLAWAHQRSGALTAADRCYRRVISMDEKLDRLGHRYRQAETQSRYGDLRYELGDTEGALRLWRKAHRTLDELNHPQRDAVQQKIIAALSPFNGTSSRAAV